jgi:hypothetical protein
VSILDKLNYSLETGAFTWKTTGKEAGSISNNGYRKIQLGGKNYYAHRLAFLAVTGQLPTAFVDHIDGNRDNNSFENLRLVNRKTNNQNIRQAKQNNKLDVLGVRKRGNSYTAQICVDGKSQHLGTYGSFDLASNAYLKAKRDLHVGCTI